MTFEGHRSINSFEASIFQKNDISLNNFEKFTVILLPSVLGFRLFFAKKIIYYPDHTKFSQPLGFIFN